jgi:hypothetical protein
MSSTMRFTSQAPLLISCTLPLATIAQQPAGSFRERTASHFFFQQSCPPNFPMPDIWEWQGAGPIDLPSFAPVWLKSSFGWNRPLMFGSVPAEIVSGQFHKLAETTARSRKKLSARSIKSSHFPLIVRFQSALVGTMGPSAAFSQFNKTGSGAPTTAENQYQSKPFFA